ncbi:hypothetical protein [Deinococcus yunweiensis]|uniref:hypothetical protein n=1 Tax=Deinococcus yunweiensis TaxID=367282 RepID=UPI00398F42A3
MRRQLTCLILTLVPFTPAPWAAAQGIPPAVLHQNDMARGALKEVNSALKAAISSGSRDRLLAAIEKYNTVIADLADLEYQGLGEEVKVSRDLSYRAMASLLEVMTRSCEAGSLGDGMKAGELVRALDRNAITSQGVGVAHIARIRDRLPDCLALELQIDSSMTFIEANYRAHFEVKVPLKYNLGTGLYSGTGMVQRVHQSLEKSGCTATYTFRPTPFRVNRLELRLNGALGVKDVVLDDYDPGTTGETMTLLCPPAPPMPIAYMNWGTTFSTARRKSGNLSIDTWRIGFPAVKGVIASKSLSQDIVLREATDMLLVRPRKK